MELQEYFDKTVEHLRSGQGRAVGSNGRSCMYRTLDGNACAVGVHIPDGHPGLDCADDVSELIAEYPDLEGVAVVEGDDGMELALQLQAAHDTAVNWDGRAFSPHGEDDLWDAADRFDLTYTPPKKGI